MDVPDEAGTCDPLRIVAPDTARRFSSVDAVFPSLPPGLERFSGFLRRAVGLSRTWRGGGTVFPVPRAMIDSGSCGTARV